MKPCVPLLGFTQEHNTDRLKAIVYDRYKELKLEPPSPGRVERMVRSAVKRADESFFTGTLKRLSPEIRKQLDDLLTVDADAGRPASARFLFWYDRDDAGTKGQQAAIEILRRHGSKFIQAEGFDWNITFLSKRRGEVKIPAEIEDICDFDVPQLRFLRKRGVM